MRPAADAARFGELLLQRLGRDGLAPPPIRSRILARMPAAAAVIAPDSADAIAEVLALCTAEAWPVRTVGAGTCVRDDARPVVVISTARLSAITEHEPADLVVGAQAGVSLSGLGTRLRAARQWLPLDPADDGDGTLGAAVAAGAAGPLRAAHGTPRDLTLGVDVVTGDGRLLRFGGRVVKNVAGYDAVRLLVGSRGRLGVVTHAFLRLRGLPQRDVTLLAPLGRGAAAGRAGAARGLEVRDRLDCAALELLHVPAVTGHDGWFLAVRLAGSEPGVAAAVQRLRELLPAAAVLDGAGDFWGGLARSERAAGGHETHHLLPTEVAGELPALAGEVGQGACVAVHLTEGVVRVWRPGEAAPGARRQGLPSLGEGRSRVESMTRHLYAVFDPAGILQPAGVDE